MSFSKKQLAVVVLVTGGSLGFKALEYIPPTISTLPSYYPYDILVIAIHGHYDLPLGGVPLDSISYGVFVGPDSEFNSGSRLYIEPGGLEDSHVPDGPLWTKEAASLAAARNAIRTALRIAEKGLSFSKLVIKTESQNMVTCMTETPSQSSAFDNAREMRRKNLMYCAELRKTAVLASTKGIEVMLWAVERGTNREAIQLAELAMKTPSRGKFQSLGR
ncbi:hypothetical protein HYFRA_00004522 [Hymenoscyphus fraxineus]|uniref:RNase H type-1 domain-containing protein n=1 Tax=Hymenoscyphus fraxineus TaxID=746836 RepID=A0A9N9KXH5_9HELO|nr:hypothetical protein HYFRA_00004522 [Hymenoscyphus fraxineus]